MKFRRTLNEALWGHHNTNRSLFLNDSDVYDNDCQIQYHELSDFNDDTSLTFYSKGRQYHQGKSNGSHSFPYSMSPALSEFNHKKLSKYLSGMIAIIVVLITLRCIFTISSFMGPSSVSNQSASVLHPSVNSSMITDTFSIFLQKHPGNPSTKGSGIPTDSTIDIAAQEQKIHVGAVDTSPCSSIELISGKSLGEEINADVLEEALDATAAKNSKKGGRTSTSPCASNTKKPNMNDKLNNSVVAASFNDKKLASQGMTFDDVRGVGLNKKGRYSGTTERSDHIRMFHIMNEMTAIVNSSRREGNKE